MDIEQLKIEMLANLEKASEKQAEANTHLAKIT